MKEGFMVNSRTSNYEIMKKQMSEMFIKYDQDKMIRKFSLPFDEGYLYIKFVGRKYRINRKNGIVEWSEDGFCTVTEGDYNETMSIYDVLCYSKDECVLSGQFCPTNMLKGTVQSSSTKDNIFQSAADQFAGKIPQLEKACKILGKKSKLSGDVAATLDVFEFLPVIFQFWDADEDFPANVKFMVDENIIDFMHFETMVFMLGHVIKRIQECMG